MKPKQLLKLLRSHGVEVLEQRGKGGHVLVRYQGRQSIVPLHGNLDLGPTFIKKICRQLGIELGSEG
ncbi:MAG: type II toxin-antitoxin system HicA family toxin [Desulfarculus sp.]|nr:type II toxin-antitoxin system HicA family toxin [Desulfarculus sp.]